MENERQEIVKTGFHVSIKALTLLLPIGTAAIIVIGLANGEAVGTGLVIILSFGAVSGAATYWVFVTHVLLDRDVVREQTPFPPSLRAPIEIRHEAIRRFKFHTGVVYIDAPDARVHVRMGMTDWYHFIRETYIRACRAQGRRVPVSGNPRWERQALGTEEEIEAAIAERGKG